ncbi:hypothetical protein [Curtobacterium sp. MCSS17_015]|uniref:hypothetical protein n=1 Tax=Curtobacterium sp. MCSS17_015 TaxID=2175666 RepID=UPI0011B82475|nr:hypothetical protein [Curtobacterium sp. MCSS17_015]WIB25347.1 hypothetical protein DEJ18_09750 [Curtobacterium sp. MCSS17_015]
MTRRHPSTVLTAAITVGISGALLLTACSGGDTPAPTKSASATRTASPTPTRTPSQAPAPSMSAAPSAPADEASAPGSDDDTNDGSGQGTGNGSGVTAPDTVDFGTVTQQGVAAAGGGTVVSLTGGGDLWTVVVAGPDGSLTQSVVSATLGRVTSGPFPKDSDAAAKGATAARAAALRVDADAAVAKATAAVPGSSLTGLQLGGSGSAPVWNATVTSGGASRSVTVDGVTGATRAS